MAESAPDAELEGVWIVWASSGHEDGISGVWAEEIEALRFVNDNGYGKAEFHGFGEIA